MRRKDACPLRPSLAFLVLAGMLAALPAPTQEADGESGSGPRVEGLRVEVSSGDVRVVGRDGDTAITLAPSEWVLITYVDGRATLSGAVPDGESVTIYVPRDTPVSIDVHKGAATVVGTYGDIDADIDIELAMDLNLQGTLREPSEKASENPVMSGFSVCTSRFR